VNAILSQTKDVQKGLDEIKEGRKAFKSFVDDRDAFVKLVSNSMQLEETLKNLETEVEQTKPPTILRILGLKPYLKQKGVN